MSYCCNFSGAWWWLFTTIWLFVSVWWWLLNISICLYLPSKPMLSTQAGKISLRPPSNISGNGRVMQLSYHQVLPTLFAGG
jgi:hypothetical protein